MKKQLNMKTGIHVLGIMLLFSVLLLGGCKKNKSTDNLSQPSDVESTIDEQDVSQVEEDTQDEEDIIEPNNDKNTSNNEIFIYGIQGETLESEQVGVLIPEEAEITADYIVNQVVEVFAEDSIEIGIDSVIVEGDNVIVSFQSDKAPLYNVGSGVESTILDSFAMSLLDNIETCKNVIFRVEGKAYQSGHIELGIDEIYKWK